MNFWFLRNYRKFCASVDDHNNVLLLVNHVATIKNIISVRKHSRPFHLPIHNVTVTFIVLLKNCQINCSVVPGLAELCISLRIQEVFGSNITVFPIHFINVQPMMNFIFLPPDYQIFSLQKWLPSTDISFRAMRFV